MKLPQPRGPVSDVLVEMLRGAPHRLSPGLGSGLVDEGAVHDEDLQLTLHICYELHYRGWDGVDDRWEWDPSLLALRAAAEERFERDLHRLVAQPVAVPADGVPRALVELTSADDGPSLARYLFRHATLGQFREFVMHRSVYHLKEADPHTWAIPRLGGRPKAALVEIQVDEYGGGQQHRMHSELFRQTMRELGLDTTYGAYVGAVPAITLATNNLMSLFGLHRRHRGALLGHLAAFEMTSSLPNRRYGNGLRRLGGNADATRFYDEHVAADAVHEQIAAHDMCGAFCREHPSEAPAVLFGAACGLTLDRLFATHVLAGWERGESSLRAPGVPLAMA
jgi:hypothetical protein